MKKLKGRSSGAQCDPRASNSSPRLSRNLVFAGVTKGPKKGMELARGIEPPTG